MPSFNPDAANVLDRAIRRKLTASNSGDLAHDLTAAVLEAAVELLRDEGECTVDELNALFGLRWFQPEWTLPLNDLEAAIDEIEENLYSEEGVLELLMGTVASAWSVVGSSPEGSATMMSDGGIGLYDFTIDDGVYFFVLAECDVCDSQWWFAHAVGDLESRADAIRDAQAVFGIAGGDDDEE
jgi:hypothetical protein